VTPPGEAGTTKNRRPWREEALRLDVAVYAAVAATPTPTMDAALRRLSRAADYSRLWITCSGLSVAFGGERGRRAAGTGLASIAITSAVVNQVLKRLGNRRRPDRSAHGVPATREIDMPRSTSWPSGHAASAFAFTTGFGSVWPEAGGPLGVIAALVAYSRVHTGVHYPSDAIAGALSGMTLAQLTVAGLERRRRPRRR
jgi:undecaprenyl-diphosphatase